MKRNGFTLIEILVVIGVILLLTSLTLAVFKPSNTDKIRSAARVAQSAILGAKDRALHAKEPRGIRLIRNTTDPTLVTGLAYLQPLPILSTDGISTLIDNANQSVRVILPPSVGASWFQQDQAGLWTGPVSVRVPANSGQWYSLQSGWVSSNAGVYSLTIRSVFRFDAPSNQWVLVAPAPTGLAVATTCDVMLGNDVLPFHQPISLPSGIVIDLKNSGGAVSALVAQANGGAIDIMFSPRGGVAGYLAGLGPLHFLMRDLRSCTAGVDPTNVAAVATANSDLMVLTVFPQTGLVQVFEADQQDLNGNGFSDDLFSFAKAGKAAGR